ncbi:MAG TPA: winged helix DNA-binding domain-containing protein [Anaerolineales bacterium]|nr:winged helix DNA-binding domain-containing protein [Anaerolineales bacterium]
MTLEVIRLRLHNQLLSQSNYSQPAEVVEWLGPVQSQDYAGAKWALAQRLEDPTTDAAIEKAFNEGKILRTHMMRPTWHFVTPTDICWMLELTAPRVRVAMAHMDRQLGLDRAIIKRSNATLKKALQGNQQLMRSELGPILEKAGVSVEGYRLGQLMGHAELDGVICSGARKGKQFTYALLEERAPHARKLQRDEALAELTRRYFRSHGPATLQDFVWWSGLTMTDARKGLEAVNSEFEQEVVDDRTYWFAASTSGKRRSARAHLLSSYDEYTVGYRDRSAIFDVSHTGKLSAFRESVLTQVILIDGEISGTWKRTIRKSKVTVELAPFTELTSAHNQAVLAAAHRYGTFLDLPVEPII